MLSSERLRRGRGALVLLVAAVVVPCAAYLIWDLGQGGARFSLKTPWALVALLLLPLLFWLLSLRGQRRKAAMAFSATGIFGSAASGIGRTAFPLPPILRVVAIALLVVALARPQSRERGAQVQVEGIDILLALDLSHSMEANDLRPNRLEAAKRVIDDFITRRRSDRIGLVVFGKEAYTHCPLTLDYSVLRNMLGELQLGLIDGKATAIGNALGVSLARLRKSDAKSRVVILLTDGENNAGNVSPKQAARYAEAMKVKVFTILMGPKPGQRPPIRTDVFGRPLPAQQFAVNPKLLQEIADQTGGKAYIATDRQALAENFEAILDELEKSVRKDVAAVYTDAYRPFAALALLLLLGELLLGFTRLREFP